MHGCAADVVVRGLATGAGAGRDESRPCSSSPSAALRPRRRGRGSEVTSGGEGGEGPGTTFDTAGATSLSGNRISGALMDTYVLPDAPAEPR
jgi:hypothetical protein